MNSKPHLSVSIITVCFNERERIRETLVSAIEQSYPHKELIVVDGGSTDGTREIIAEFSSDIDHLISENDDGVYHAMNKGFSLATGDYIFFLNGGDKFHDPKVLSKVFLDRDTSYEIIFGDISYVYPNGKITTSHLPSTVGYLFFTFNTICHQALFCIRKILAESGGFNTNYKIAADYDFLLSAFFTKHYSSEHITTPISYFYRDGVSHAQESKSLLREERLEIQEKHLPWPYFKLSQLRYWALRHKDRVPAGKIKQLGNRLFNLIFRPREL
jgi:glycosyltransferase involved in cell wall biosynthesis